MAPFRGMLVLTVFVTVSYLLMVYLLLHDNDDPPNIDSGLPILCVLILTRQTIAYWNYRNIKIRDVLAWFHIGALYFALAIMPASNYLLNEIYTRRYPIADYTIIMTQLSDLRPYLLWIPFIISQIAFVLVTIDVRKKRAAELREKELDVFESI
jgi:hypothetical protein